MKTTKSNPTLLLIALIIVVTIGCSKDEVHPSQLLHNGNVESGSLQPNDWWYSTGENKYNVTWTDEESSSPSKSLKISTQTSDPTDFAFWAQTTTNQGAGKSATLKVKIKSNLEGKGISIVIRGDDTTIASGAGEQFVTTQGTRSISGVFDWTEYSITLDKVEASTKSLTIYLVYLQDTTGEVYFDDITLDN